MRRQHVAGLTVFALVVVITSANQFMLMPFERASAPALRTAPDAVVLIPVFLAAGFHVTLFMLLATALVVGARVLSPDSPLAEFRAAAAVTGLAHIPLLVWALVSTYLVVAALRALKGLPITPGVLDAIPEARDRFSMIAATRPWAWWGSALAIVVAAAGLSSDWRPGVRVALIVVGLLTTLNFVVIRLLGG